MAAATKSTKYNPLGTTNGPDESVLISSVNLDVNSNIDFSIIGPCEAVELTIVATSITGAPSVVFNLQRFDEASGTFITLLSSTAMVAAGNKSLLIYHGLTAVANVSAQRIVSEKLRLNIAYTGTPATDVLNGLTVTALAI